jgi:soluble P-type ATPase
MKYSVPEVGEIEITNIILDLNGTLSVNGVIPKGVESKLRELSKVGIKVVLFTGDQRGTAADLCKGIGIDFIKCKNSQEKADAMSSYDKDKTAAIGNARIDIGTFKNAVISVATLQAEGIHTGIIEHVDIIVPSIEDALALFLDKDIFSATMRK